MIQQATSVLLPLAPSRLTENLWPLEPPTPTSCLFDCLAKDRECQERLGQAMFVQRKLFQTWRLRQAEYRQDASKVHLKHDAEQKWRIGFRYTEQVLREACLSKEALRQAEQGYEDACQSFFNNQVQEKTRGKEEKEQEEKKVKIQKERGAGEERRMVCLELEDRTTGSGEDEKKLQKEIRLACRESDKEDTEIEETYSLVPSGVTEQMAKEQLARLEHNLKLVCRVQVNRILKQKVGVRPVAVTLLYACNLTESQLRTFAKSHNLLGPICTVQEHVPYVQHEIPGPSFVSLDYSKKMRGILVFRKNSRIVSIFFRNLPHLGRLAPS